MRGPWRAAVAGALLILGLTAAWRLSGTDPTVMGLHVGFFLLFGGAASCRLLLPVLSQARPSSLRPARALPSYAVIAPLRDEAAMAGQIVRSLSAIDYPRELLDVVIVLEADDRETHDALLAEGLPTFMRLLIAPPQGPLTKPRACNLALAATSSELVVIYDAEDEPDARQLREAAARFAAAPSRLGCLQAPLRVHARSGWLQRQFALEYAALFEVIVPALAALRLPFPLGGTSNHFRRTALEDAGGWDAFNVTEDADVGFRLAARGWTLGVLSSPTWEEAPETVQAWVPQRARWLKGYVQTWSVAMRRPLAGGWRRFLALQGTMALAILSSLLHGPLMLFVSATLLVTALSLDGSSVLIADAMLLAFSWGSTVICLATGAERAGFRMTLGDALGALAYWPMQSLAAIFALHQLVTHPFRWDKTPHRPAEAGEGDLDESRGGRIARAA